MRIGPQLFRMAVYLALAELTSDFFRGALGHDTSTVIWAQSTALAVTYAYLRWRKA